jgi:microcystin-dependent protein
MERIRMIGGGTVNSCPFPVGFGGFFQTDPNSIYSGTTWEQKQDVFILASGDTYAAGSTGGEAEHVLTEAEMPKHSHQWNGREHTTLSHTGTQIPIVGHDPLFQIQTTGGSQPHNNMPPYYTMPFWIRTA